MSMFKDKSCGSLAQSEKMFLDQQRHLLGCRSQAFTVHSNFNWRRYGRQTADNNITVQSINVIVHSLTYTGCWKNSEKH